MEDTRLAVGRTADPAKPASTGFHATTTVPPTQNAGSSILANRGLSNRESPKLSGQLIETNQDRLFENQLFR
jgi:hypothetical protein